MLFRPRGLQEGAIGQQQRPGGVVGQADAGHVARGLGAEGGAVQLGLDQVAEGQEGQLVGQLERPGGAGLPGVQGEDATGGIIAAQRLLTRHIDGADPVPVGQQGLQRPFDRAVLRDVRRQGLGRRVQAVDVVVAVMEEVADLLIGQEGDAGAQFVAAQGVVQRLHPLVQLAEGLVQGQELMGQARGVGDGLFQLGRRRRLGPAADRAGDVGGGLAQIGDQPGVALQIEQAGVDVEGAGQGDQDAGGGRALIGLDLRQIRRRQAQPLGAGLQRPAARLAQLAQFGTEEELLSHSQICSS